MKAFISSTYEDLADYRAKAAEAIERLGQQGVRMEVFGARPDDATFVCRDEIEAADVFVGIYAHRYGFVPTGTVDSITEQEYKSATNLAKPRFCFIIDDNHPWRPALIEGEPGRTRLVEFKKCISGAVVRDRFTTPDDLAFKISASLGRYLITRSVKEALDLVSEDKPSGSDNERSQVARRAARLASLISGTRLLLVNDVPYEMADVTRIYLALGVDVVVSRTTEEALAQLADSTYDVIVSDMCRDGIENEGIRFLKQMRELGMDTPTIITLARFDPSRGTPAYAFGITNRIDELLNLTFDAIERVRG